MVTGIPFSEVGVNELHDDRLFKKFILRRAQDDSVCESKDSYQRMGSITNKSIINRSMNMKKKVIGLPNISPRKTETTSFLNSSQDTLFKRAPARAMGRSIIYGDKFPKKNILKNVHPLHLFVVFSNLRVLSIKMCSIISTSC